MHRESVSEFKRKPLQEISDIEDADEILEAARLAPSANNHQAWFFTGNKSIIHTYFLKPNFFRGILGGKYIPIDVGIAIYHLKLATEHFDKKTEIVMDKTAPDYSSKGYEYVASLKLE